MKCVSILLFNLTGESRDRESSVIKWCGNVKTTQYETLAMTTAMTRKTSLENEYLRNCDYSRLSHLVRIL